MRAATLTILAGLTIVLARPPALHAEGSPNVDRVILFLVDGLHVQVLEHLEMPVFRGLIPQGTYAPESWMIMPHHPTVGDYGQRHSSSYPNPVLMAGTLFVRPENRFVQESVNAVGATAFVVNIGAYASVSRGFTRLTQDSAASDDQVIEAALAALEDGEYAFMRIHLQAAGNLGRACAYAAEDKAYHRNIWGAGSPYTNAVANADRLLGRFIDFLKAQGRWAGTVLIVSSDQGQSAQGWHPVSDPDSWRTPLLFVGPGIARGRRLSYAEHTDLAPTICQLLGVNPPNPGPGSGRPMEAVLADHADDSVDHPRFIEKINRQNIEYLNCRAVLQLASDKDSYYSSQISLLENELITEEPFYGIDRFLEWHRAGSTAHLVEANERILEQLRPDARAAAALLGLQPSQVPWKP